MCGKVKTPPPPKETPPPPPPPPAPAIAPAAESPVINAETTDTKAKLKAGRAGTKSLRIDLATGPSASGAPAPGLNIPTV